MKTIEGRFADNELLPDRMQGKEWAALLDWPPVIRKLLQYN